MSDAAAPAAPEPFGTYHFDNEVAIEANVKVTWMEIGARIASANSRDQAHFLNVLVGMLRAACGGAAGAQMQACYIAREQILEPRTVELLEDLVGFYKERG